MKTPIKELIEKPWIRDPWLGVAVVFGLSVALSFLRSPSPDLFSFILAVAFLLCFGLVSFGLGRFSRRIS
jgi:hypothetical protein